MAEDNKTKKIEYATLLSVLANGSTHKANRLLKKHSGIGAKNVKDLELKLAKAYSDSTSKIDMEREFAQIHPHKDFILKYTLPEILKQEELKKTDNNELQQLRIENERLKEVELEMNKLSQQENKNLAFQHQPCNDPDCVYCGQYLNKEKSSNFNGTNENLANDNNRQSDMSIIAIALIGAFALLSFVAVIKNSK